MTGPADSPQPADPAPAAPDPAAGASVLLVGGEAERLAPRLALSGYRTCLLPEASASLPPQPRAIILAADAEDQIAALRRRFPGIPLLLGVGSDSLEGRVRCLASGADDFWITTIGPSDLLTRLRLHLARGPQRFDPPSAPAPPLQVADLSVSPATGEVRRGRRLLQLTAREYDLLLLLLRRSGAVVSREQILSAIWREERPAASNVIEVYVRYLRQKLEQGGERRLIHTVRGKGYCLAERLPPGSGGPP